MKEIYKVGPFDDSAPSRLEHMGLLDKSGHVETTHVDTLSHIMAGLFFDGLCDHYNDLASVNGVYQDLRDYLAQGDYRRLLLRYSLQYDMLHQPLPAAVWWITGDQDMVRTFFDSFMKYLGELMSFLVASEKEVAAQ